MPKLAEVEFMQHGFQRPDGGNRMLSAQESMKDLQRKAGMDARNRLDRKTIATFSQIISKKLISSSFGNAKVMLSYQPFGNEVDVSTFNEWTISEGKTLAFPLCYEDGKMVAAVPGEVDGWEIGKYGIKTPIESRSTILNPADIDLVIVPCTVFARARKIRCGMGVGYYDRYLPQCNKAITIAVAFSVQQCDDLIADDWDFPLDSIVTEEAWY